MNTPPKATKYRIRKIMAPSARPKPAPPEADMPFAPAPEDDGFGALDMTDRQKTPEPLGPEAEAELEKIRAEGLTGRELRMARRVALRHGIDAASDIEAVLLLRRRGIDPFQRINVLDLVAPAPAGPPRAQLPALAPSGQALPSVQVKAEAERARAIMEMQRDIVRRRRRNFGLLMMRLAFFVIAPTILAGYYYYRLATPLYATRSEFVITQADAQSMGGIGSLFGGTQLGTSKDSITVQGFLQSRGAMLRLDKEEGYRAHFSQDFIDPLQRLDPGASDEATYRLYSRNVKVAYDPTEGILKMEVVAADPATSQRFAEALIAYAEEQVDDLTLRVREDHMKDARAVYEDAERKVREAEQTVLDLQTRLGVLDPKAETGVAMGQVAELEGLLAQKELQLRQLLDNPKPNQARVDGVKGDIERLKVQIASLRDAMTGTAEEGESLANITGQIRIAETELLTRQQMLAKSLEQLETARIEANRQVRYLSVGVSPVAPDEATYPRAFENTVLAFMIFMGIYLMLSMTASILREQVTA